MTKNFIWLVILMPIFLSCEKDTTSEDLKGDLIGSINIRDEFTSSINYTSNIKVLLDGSDPLLETYTDSLGNFEIKNIPSGVYNLIAKKDGYGEYQYQGIQITGGPEPMYLWGIYLFKKSSTIIESISLTNDDDKIYLSGIVHHDYGTFSSSTLKDKPCFRYFIHTSNNPSFINYLQTGHFQYQCKTGGFIEQQIGIDKELFPTGTTIYVVAYGSPDKYYNYYNIQTNQEIYPSLSAASNITSIVVP